MKLINSKKIFLFLSTLLLLNNFSFSVVVSRVIDGDTFVLENKKVVRIIGINAPEITRGKKEYYGYKAKEYLESLILGKKVILYFDNVKLDRFNRLLAYVYTENKIFVNAEMIRNGYAYVYRKYPFKMKKIFIEYENEAKLNKRGLWKKKFNE